MPGLAQPELAVLLLGRRLLPLALFEIVSLAFLSALLSTGDSVLITGATVLALDVLKLRRASLARIRLLTLGLALAGLGLALYTRQLLEIMKFGYTLLTASLIVPAIFTLALAGRRKPRTGFVLAAIGAGLGAASLWKAAPLLISGFQSPLDPATIGVGCSAAVMAASLFFPSHPALARTLRFQTQSNKVL
jgi:Na+/proline symporter